MHPHHNLQCTPYQADNGYYLYCNKAYSTDEEVQRLDRMLEVGLNEDGLTIYCTWDSTDGPIQGTDVAQAMLNIAASPAFSDGSGIPCRCAGRYRNRRYQRCVECGSCAEGLGR